MKILITGYQGFIGKNLVAQLKNRGYEDLLLYDVTTEEAQLDSFLNICDFVFHLAGVNRTQEVEEFEQGNKGLAEYIVNKLESCSNNCPIVACSSIHAQKDTPYGISKKAMEEVMFRHARSTGASVYVYRLPNVYGKWCMPNYNSAVATFCHNITRNLELHINNPGTELQLVYIDDVVNEFINCLENPPVADEQGFCNISEVSNIKLEALVLKLRSFYESRQMLETPVFESDFDRKLYAVFVSYYPENEFSYKLEKNLIAEDIFANALKISISDNYPSR